MKINITQRQASLTIMIMSAATVFAILIGALLFPSFPVRALPLFIALLILISVWFAYYHYNWEPARIIYSLLTPFMLATAVQTEVLINYTSMGILVPPIIALVMTRARWVLITGTLTWLLIAQLAGWQGTFVRPAGMLTFCFCVLGLVVSRLILETSQRAARESERHAKDQAEKLRLSESRYRTLTASLPNTAVLLFDHSLNFVLIEGPEVEKMGYSKTAMEGKSLYDAIPQASIAAIEPNMRAVLAGKRFSSEMPYRDQIYTFHYLPLENEHGQIPYGMILAQNVTEQRQAEEAQRISEEHYRIVSGMLSDYAFAFNVDEAGNLERAWMTIGSFTHITGYDSDGFNSLGAYELFSENEREKVRVDVERVIGGQEISSEYQILTKQGEKRWLRIHRYPVWDEDKTRVVRFYGVAQDITARKEVEEALRKNEEQMRVIVTNLPLVFFVLDTNGVFTVSEGKGLSLLGLKPGEIVGLSIFDLYQDERDMIENVRRALAGEITYALNKMGDLVFEVFFNPIYDDENKIVGVTGVGVDTTERKKAEDALAKERKLMRALIDHLPDNIYVKDREGKFVLNNAESLRILGVSRQEDTLGKSDMDFLPLDRSERWLTLHQDIMQTDQPFREKETFQPWNTDERRWIVESMIPLHDDDGMVIGLIGINRDITQRKQAENALQQSEERYRLISELISDYAFSYTVGFDRTSQNSWITLDSYERVTGYRSPYELSARYDLYHPDDRERAKKDVETSGMGQPTAGEYRIITKSGELRWIYLRRRPQWSDEEQRVVSVYGAAQDITARKHAEEELQRLNAELEQRVTQRTLQLEEANRELEAFTYSVSHDLRAPLRAINGFSRTVAQNYISHLPERAQYYLTRIEANATRMNTLIDDLLALSRLGRKEIKPQLVDMNQLVQQVLHDLLAAGQGGAVQFTLGKLPPCYADASLLEQVLINIVSNAIKYSSKTRRPQIEIASITKDNEIIYYTKDNGAGFDAQYADKLFGVFQRLHSEEDFEGTGIGLATVRRIITRHGGRVWAESESGKGATFYFIIGTHLSA